jgi:hypothetical protein
MADGDSGWRANLNSSERLGGTGGQTVTTRAISARWEFIVQDVGAKDTSPVARVKRASNVLHVLTHNLAWLLSSCGNLNQSIYGSQYAQSSTQIRWLITLATDKNLPRLTYHCSRARQTKVPSRRPPLGCLGSGQRTWHWSSYSWSPRSLSATTHTVLQGLWGKIEKGKKKKKDETWLYNNQRLNKNFTIRPQSTDTNVRLKKVRV